MCFVSFSAYCGEGVDGFKNTKAKVAQKKYNDAVEKAKKEYDDKVAKAQEVYKKDLDAALKDEMKKGDLDEANKIKEVIDSFEADMNDESIKKIILSQKWENYKKDSVITFNENKTITTSAGKVGSWKIEDNTLYIRLYVSWDVVIEITKQKMVIKNNADIKYTWTAK
jgi:hypothetical protein